VCVTVGAMVTVRHIMATMATVAVEAEDATSEVDISSVAVTLMSLS